MQILKYVLSSNKCKVYMPKDAEILVAKEQNGTICIWALADTSKPLSPRLILSFNTGVEFPPLLTTMMYLGTVQMPNKGANPQGEVVWHVFEVKRDNLK